MLKYKQRLSKKINIILTIHTVLVEAGENILWIVQILFALKKQTKLNII